MKPQTPTEIVSYMIGRQVGDQLKSSQMPTLDLDLLGLGIRDSLGGAPVTLNQAEIARAFDTINAEMQVAQSRQAETAREEGEAFLAANSQRPGVVTTQSGLQYEVLEMGQGQRPTQRDRVRTHYHGMFIDGRVFDSSVERGEPAEFPVGGVISGWTEALQLMPEGSKWRLYIPSELAYGEQGSGGAIPPNSALVFDVELLAVLG